MKKAFVAAFAIGGLVNLVQMISILMGYGTLVSESGPSDMAYFQMSLSVVMMSALFFALLAVHRRVHS